MISLSRSLAGLAVAATLAAPAVHAQSAAASAPKASAPATAPVAIDPEKQKLIDQILAVFHPENPIIIQAQHPAQDAMEKSSIVMQQNHLPKEKIEKTLKDIQVDAQKYIDSITPLVANSTHKNVGPAVAPILAQNFSVQELQDLLALLKSPVKAKFEKLVPDMETATLKRVQSDIGQQVDKQITELNKAAGAKLQAAAMTN